MNEKEEYTAAVAMHNHYSSARAAVISLAAPIQVTIVGFSISGSANMSFEISMLIFSIVFFVSVYVVWQFFSAQLRVVKLFLLRKESGAGNDDRLFAALYGDRGESVGNRRLSLAPKEVLDYVILVFGLVTIGAGLLSRVEWVVGGVHFP